MLTHTHMQIQQSPHTLTQAHSSAYIGTYTHTHTSKCSHTLTQTHSSVYTSTYTHTHTHTEVPAYTDTPKCSYTFTQVQVHTHCTCSHAQIWVHMYRDTCTPMYPYIPSYRTGKGTHTPGTGEQGHAACTCQRRKSNQDLLALPIESQDPRKMSTL